MVSEKGRIDPEAQVRTVPDPAGAAAAAGTAPSAAAPPYPESADPEAIRRDIERTRSEMDSTLDALGDRMSPRHLLDELFEFWHGGDATRGARRGFRETGVRLAESVRDHPVPAALIGAGLAWMFFEEKRPSGYTDEEWRARRPGTFERETEEPGLMEKTREKMAEAGHSVKEAVTGAGERAGVAGHRMHAGYESSRRTLDRWLDEAPLAAGVAALAAGLAAGLLLPETRRENELFGEASDRLKEQARSAGSDLMERSSRIASETAEAAAGEAREQGLGPQGILDKAGRVLSDVKETARESAEREGIGPSQLRSVAETAREKAGDEVRRQKDQMKEG